MQWHLFDRSGRVPHGRTEQGRHGRPLRRLQGRAGEAQEEDLEATEARRRREQQPRLREAHGGAQEPAEGEAVNEGDILDTYTCLECGGRIAFLHHDNGYAVYKCLHCSKRFTLKVQEREVQLKLPFKEATA